MSQAMAASTLAFMAETCGSMLQLKQIHAYSITSSLINFRNVFATVFNFVAMSPLGDVLYAHQMFDQMSDPERYFGNTLIRGYTKSSFPSGSLFLFNQMRRIGIKPDEVSFNFVIKGRTRSTLNTIYDMYVTLECDEIHSLIVKLGFNTHLFVQNSLIHLYAKRGCPAASRKVFNETAGVDTVSWSGLVFAHIKAGELTTARQVFDAMPERDVVSWTAMISGYTRAKQSVEALELFAEMMEAGHRPDEITLISVLSACKATGNLEFGIRVHRFIEANGFGWMVSLCNTLIDMYGKCGCIDRAWMVFNSMHRKSLFTWNIMISALSEQGNPDDALWLFRCMLDATVAPDKFTMIALLRAHGRRGSVDDGCKLFETMRRDYGVETTVEHYGCVVAMLCQVERLEEAYQFIVKLPNDCSAGVWRCLLNACRDLGRIDLEEKVLKKLLESNPGHPMYLALLHDIYCLRANGSS